MASGHIELTGGIGRAVPHYIPILKGRLGELKALEQTTHDRWQRFTPLVEAVAGDADLADEDVLSAVTSLNETLRQFALRLTQRWPEDRALIIDAGLISSPEPTYNPMAQLVEEFRYAGRKIRPTVRPSDTDDVLASVAEAMRNHQIGDACIRLAGEDLDDVDEPIAVGIERVLRIVGIPPQAIDLVLDFGAVPDERTAALASRIARLVIGELPHRDGWRTLVVASGAFPADLNMIQPGVPGELPRHDVDLYRRVRDRAERLPDYGDYAIAHPALASGAGFAPAPQIRYTVDESWTVIKGRRSDRRGAAQFFDICEQLTRLHEVDAAASWGDWYIAEAAANAGEIPQGQVTSGNAMTWRAIGTNHHIAHMVSALASRGVL